MGMTTKYARLRDSDAQMIIMIILGYDSSRVPGASYLKKPDSTTVITTRLHDGNIVMYFQIKFRDLYGHENSYEIAYDETSGPILKYKGLVKDYLTHFGIALGCYKNQSWVELQPLFDDLENKARKTTWSKKAPVKLNMYNCNPIQMNT